jgi:hypothetical protein
MRVEFDALALPPLQIGKSAERTYRQCLHDIARLAKIKDRRRDSDESRRHTLLGWITPVE